MGLFKREKPNIAAQGTMFTKKEIWALLIPLLIEQLLSYLVGLADSMMVSSVGEAAVSAVSLVDSISVLMVNIFAALASGGAIVVGQYLGLQLPERARKSGQQLLLTLLVLSLAVMALLMLFEDGLLGVLFGRSDITVQENCHTYYHIVMLSVPFIALYNGGAALFRAIGDSKTPMKISFLMNGINIGGNALLIYGCKMGVAGVALPTLVSRGIAMVMILALAMRRKFSLSLRGGIGSYRPKWQVIRQILSMGIPYGVENGMFQLGKILLLSLVSSLPLASVTANAIGNTMTSLQCVAGVAGNMGIVSVVSRCVGAGDYPQTRYYMRYLLGVIYKLQAIFTGIMLAAIPLILKIYDVSEEAAHLATIIMLIHGIGCIVLWPLAFCVNTGMRAAGDARFTMVVAVVSMWLCRVGLGYLFVLFCNTGVLGIWYAWMIDWLFRIVFFLPRYYGTKWETKAIAYGEKRT